MNERIVRVHDFPALTAARKALSVAKSALADAHESLSGCSERFAREGDGPADALLPVHSAIAFCECPTAKAYRAAKAALKG